MKTAIGTWAKRPIDIALLMIAGLALSMASAARAADTTPARPPAAQTTGNGGPAASGATTAAAPPSGPPAACTWPTSQPLLPSEDARAAMAILPSTRWQPLNGDVQFELTGVVKSLDSLTVYFAWSDVDHSKPFICLPSLRVRLLPPDPNDDGQTYRYAARVPALVDGSQYGITGFDHWHFPSVVPNADIFVSSDKSPEAQFTATVGITTPWVAFVGAIVSVLAVAAFLGFTAAQRAIPGGRIIRIISTPNGVASLSQFQILIWTFVIGAGVVYVMMLSGNLIDIPASTLGLLGITGFALVGSKLTANADGSPVRVNLPGAVTNLRASGAPTADTVVLNWDPPTSADQPLDYTVQMRAAGAGMWQAIAQDIAGPPYAVSGLEAGTSYQFQVFAMNPAGAGPAGVPVTVRTAAAAADGAAGGGIGQVTNLAVQKAEGGQITLTWNGAQNANAYTVQYRPTGTLPWSTYPTTMVVPTANGPFIASGLKPATDYQFQVFGTNGGIAGISSDLATVKTPSREPRWSDLIMSGDVNTEADLSRVQMLLFTSISAVFTGLTLINTGVIPDLPVGELALVGISNGVYLASKVSNRGGQ
jgi:hypothetical protein